MFIKLIYDDHDVPTLEGLRPGSKSSPWKISSDGVQDALCGLEGAFSIDIVLTHRSLLVIPVKSSSLRHSVTPLSWLYRCI